MEDTAGEKKALGMRRCKSAILARELPPTKTTARKTEKRLVFDKASEQIVIKEVLKDEGPCRLRRCKSASGRIFVLDSSVKVHTMELRRCKSSLGGLTVESNSDDSCKYGLRRCTSTTWFNP